MHLLCTLFTAGNTVMKSIPMYAVCNEHRQRAISKATELKDAGAMLELLPMVPTGGQYRPRAFWAQLLELDAGTVVNIEAPDADAADGERHIQRGQLSVSFLLHCAHVLRLLKTAFHQLATSCAEMVLCIHVRYGAARFMQAWAEVSRFKMFKKRTLRMTNLTLGGLSIGIQLYKMVAKAKKSTKTFQVHARTNEELITESAMIDQDTGESCFPLTHHCLWELASFAGCKVAKRGIVC